MFCHCFTARRDRAKSASTTTKGYADTGSTDSLRDQMYDLFDLNRLLGAEHLLATGERFGGEE